MGTCGLEGVKRAWELEKLTVEQAIGQILLLIDALEERQRDLERKYNKMSRVAPAQLRDEPAGQKED